MSTLWIRKHNRVTSAAATPTARTEPPAKLPARRREPETERSDDNEAGRDEVGPYAGDERLQQEACSRRFPRQHGEKQEDALPLLNDDQQQPPEDQRPDERPQRRRIASIHARAALTSFDRRSDRPSHPGRESRHCPPSWQ